MTISSLPQQALWITLVHLSFIYINQDCNNLEERSLIINSCPLKRQHILLLPKYLASHWITGNFQNILWCFLHSYMPGIPYSFHQTMKNQEKVLWNQTSLFQISVKTRRPMQDTQEMQVQSLGWEDSLQQGNLQYSYLENSLDRGDLWATVHRVAKSWKWMKWLSMHICNLVSMII